MLEKITFPEHEYESVQNWLNKQGYCYTTRVFKEVGKYKVTPKKLKSASILKIWVCPMNLSGFPEAR